MIILSFWPNFPFRKDHYFSRDLQSTVPEDYHFNGLWLTGNGISPIFNRRYMKTGGAEPIVKYIWSVISFGASINGWKTKGLHWGYIEWSQGPPVVTGFFGPTLLHIIMIFRISPENNEATQKGGCSSSCFNYTLKNHDLIRHFCCCLVRLTFHQQFHGNYSLVDFISLTFNFGVTP